MKKDDEKIIEELREIMVEAAADTKTPAYDLEYNPLQKYCKENDLRRFFEIQPKIRKLGGYTNLRDTLFVRPADDPDSLPMVRVDVQRQARENRKDTVDASNAQAFLARFETIATKIFKSKIVPSGYSTKGKSTKHGIKRELNLLLSDLHFGAALDGRITPLPYGFKEESRRLAQVVLQAAEYKEQYRNETRLRLHLGGDIIQGQLHDPRDGEPLSAQTCDAIYLLTQAVAFLASRFPEVYVDCFSGNHDRITARHKDRATLDKWDSISTIIYYAIKTATAGLKNVEISIPRTPYITYESFGAKCFGTHGDTVLNVGYPGSAINVRSLETQINKINASLANREEYKLFFVGHVHTGTLVHLGNGVKLITNSALIPPDQYSLSIGSFENSCGQSLWESVLGHVVGDYRFVEVDGSTDRDASLNKIIKPFTDF